VTVPPTQPALRRFGRVLLPLAALAGLSGCAALFGSNVRGDFQCRAPGGTCAPSARIDDQAIAVIAPSADGPAPVILSPERRSARVVATATAPARTHEKVLRIMFPPFIDERGRLHEASAIHAVVEGSDWQLAVAAGDADVAVAAPGHTLVEAVDRRAAAEAPAAVVSDTPSEAAVAAARARMPVSVEAIREEVEARIEARAPGSGAAPTPAGPQPESRPSTTGEASVVRAGGFPAQVEDPQ